MVHRTWWKNRLEEAWNVEKPFQKRSDSFIVTYCGLKDLVAAVTAAP